MKHSRSRSLPLLVWLLCLTACGRAPDDTRETTAPGPSTALADAARSPLSADPNRPIILAFGDSLTAGHMVDRSMSYPSQLQAKLEAAGYEYQVINDGESGLTTSGGLARLDRALALEPAIVVLALGGNDGLRGTPVPVARENLRRLIEAFQHEGARVILAGITLPRNYGPDYIGAFEDMYVELSDEFDVGYIPFLLDGLVDMADPTATIGRYMQADGIHPTAEGYTIVADTVFHAIEPYLEK